MSASGPNPNPSLESLFTFEPVNNFKPPRIGNYSNSSQSCNGPVGRQLSVNSNHSITSWDTTAPLAEMVKVYTPTSDLEEEDSASMDVEIHQEQQSRIERMQRLGREMTKRQEVYSCFYSTPPPPPPLSTSALKPEPQEKQSSLTQTITNLVRITKSYKDPQGTYLTPQVYVTPQVYANTSITNGSVKVNVITEMERLITKAVEDIDDEAVNMKAKLMYFEKLIYAFGILSETEEHPEEEEEEVQLSTIQTSSLSRRGSDGAASIFSTASMAPTKTNSNVHIASDSNLKEAKTNTSYPSSSSATPRRSRILFSFDLKSKFKRQPVHTPTTTTTPQSTKTRPPNTLSTPPKSNQKHQHHRHSYSITNSLITPTSSVTSSSSSSLLPRSQKDLIPATTYLKSLCALQETIASLKNKDLPLEERENLELVLIFVRDIVLKFVWFDLLSCFEGFLRSRVDEFLI